MTSKERVYQALAELLNDGSKNVTTQVIAQKLELSRSVTSHYLSQLLAEKRIQKSNGRPVIWYVISEKNTEENDFGDLTAFKEIVGVQGSQKENIRQCIAAVKYPHGGLNLMITGPSGVGKTFLAKKIYQYAQNNNWVTSTAPFKVLNCADYANNPELLSSILFGYVKGAFTGAVTSKSGLLATANGGFLFLDEVHRLSGENQEKLFTFLDTGKFRPIGENQSDSCSNVRFIFATTEDPKITFLNTFARRVPITISLTAYVKRPIDERLRFIRYLFEQEAKRLRHRIIIQPAAVKYLLDVDPIGNIGTLKNMIKVACAKNFAGVSKSQQVLTIDLTDFDLELNVPKSRYERIISNEFKLKIDTAIVQNNADLPLFSELKESIQRVLVSTDQDERDWIGEIRNLIQHWDQDQQQDSFQTDDVLHQLHQREFVHIICQKFGLKAATAYENAFFKLYQTHFVLDKKLCQQLLDRLQNNYSRSLQVTSYFYQHLAVIDQNSQIALKLILACCIADEINEKLPLRCLMVAHGSHTATSIQAVVNQLCGTYLVDAIDMPIDTTIEEISKEAIQRIHDFDTSSGFILLVDMGSLGQLYRKIKNNLSGDLLVVNNLTTAIALDVALKIQERLPFTQIAEHASQDYQISTQYFEGFSNQKNIVISCMSGLGISEKLKGIFQQWLGNNISIITMDFANLQQNIKANEISGFESTLLVITTTNLPDSFAIDHINIYDLLDAGGEALLREKINGTLSAKDFDGLYNEIVRFLSIEGVTERLSFLNPAVIIQEVETVIFKFENYYHIKIDGKIKLNLYMHISLMVERLMTGVSTKQDSLTMPITATSKKDFFGIAKGIFRPLELKYNIAINDYELSLLYELFKYIFDITK
ncbi:sigma 54-interacting transcriptional regulator [Lapidilactobacillus luobeiensis]|uniref:sigma 54-interacting transcriptional regulator n=1 Tax=Lapidilactobacillus luobeiensis TaxID=2950371 RepID=UPI0021C40CFF|nr:sigma 54-interacting transcriptional regulator [Lapidilactobacillus luobeiensis]